jgi:hypothetical protein
MKSSRLLLSVGSGLFLLACGGDASLGKNATDVAGEKTGGSVTGAGGAPGTTGGSATGSSSSTTGVMGVGGAPSSTTGVMGVGGAPSSTTGVMGVGGAPWSTTGGMGVGGAPSSTMGGSTGVGGSPSDTGGSTGTGGAPNSTGPTCGGFANLPCPGAGTCVDDPNDSCTPQKGGADCGGICLCEGLGDCKEGTHWDSSPSTCACVADVATCKVEKDCRLFDDYCGGCACDALPTTAADPVCSGTKVQCVRQPCQGRVAECIGGTCVTK